LNALGKHFGQQPLGMLMDMESLIATRLNAQWRDIATEPCPAAWELPCPDLEDARVTAREDQVCVRLVHCAQSGDQLAGRVLIQALLPKLISMSIRDQRRGLDEYVSTAWLRISDFPINRRTNAVLTNIALDVLKMLSRAEKYRELPTDQLPEQGREDSDDELSALGVITTSRKLELVTDQTAEVLVSIYADGMSGRQAAQLHGLTEAAVRRRCSDATQRMRQHAELLRAAA